MNTEDLIHFIHNHTKETPVKIYVQEEVNDAPFLCCIGKNFTLCIGEYNFIYPWLKERKYTVLRLEMDRINSAVPLLNYQNKHVRIEPGAVIRDFVELEDYCVILMGAIINIGASIGKRTMVDMNAVIGSRAIIKEDCHIGAGAVIAGVLEPVSALPVTIENHVLIGANAVILEGVTVKEHAVVAAGSVVVKDVEPYTVVAGIPARVIKKRNEVDSSKVDIVEELRKL